MTIVVSTAALAATGPALAGDPTHRPDGGTHYRTERPAPVPRDAEGFAHPQDTSDNAPGWIAPTLPRAARGTVTRTILRHYRVAPGVTQTTFRQVDARGQIRAHLIRVKMRTPGVHVDLASLGSVRTVGTVRDTIAVDKAVAGVNGDFYDIGRTGAPLGMAKDRGQRLRNAPATFPNAAFYLGPGGKPHISDMNARVVMRYHPDIPISGVNTPHVPPDGIVVYTSRWGTTAGYRVTDGERSGVWAVGVNTKGRVVAGSSRLSSSKRIKGALYVGRGEGARLLRTLRKNMRAAPVFGVVGRPKVIVTGSKILVKDGVVNTDDDSVMHPRTAVGVDESQQVVLMLVVDGRSRISRGYTLAELANLMVSLGADDALNLDGGGSSTLVGRGPKGRMRVLNRPSDGFERRVANALEVTYRKPRRSK